MQHLPLHPLRRSLITAAAFMAVSAVMLTAHGYLVPIDFVLAYCALAIIIAAVLGRRYAAAVAVAAPAASVLLVQMTGVGPHFGTGAAYARGAVIAAFSALALYAMPRWLTGADEFRRLAQTLRERTQTLETLERSAPVAIVTLDRDGAVTSWNPAAEQISGWQEAEVLGRRVADISPEGAAVTPQRMLGEVLGAGAAFQQVEATPRGKHGRSVVVSMSVAPLRGPGGDVSGLVAVAVDVTARKAADEALRRADEFRASVMESTTDAIFALDLDRRIALVNERACEITGYTREELLGQSPGLFSSPESDEIGRERFWQVVESGQPGPARERLILRKDGGHRIVRVTLTPLVDGGKVSGMVGTAEDVTEQRAADEALRRADEFRASVMETSHDAIFAMDLERRFTLVNQRACEITGYAREELLGQTPALFYPPHTVERIRGQVQQLIDTRQPLIAYEADIVRKNGEAGTIRVSLKPLLEDGEVTGMVGTAEDVTERKAADEALRRADELRASVMENTTDGIFAVDLERRFTMVNRRVCEITGYTQEELLGQTPALVTSAEVNERGRARFQEVVESAQPAEVHESQIIRKDGGRRIVRVSVTPLVDGGKVTGAVGTAQDVTERRAADEAVRRGDEFRARVMESATEGIFAMDLDGRFTLANRRGCEITGYSAEELLGQTSELFSTPEAREAGQRRFRQVVEGGQPAPPVERVVLRKDGSQRIVRASLTPLVDGGRVTGVVGTAEDVTEQMAANEAVRRGDEFRARVMESATEGIFAMDLDRRITLVNRRACEITGYTREDLLGRTLPPFSLPEADGVGRSTFRRVVESRQPGAVYEREVIRKDGGRRIVRVSLSPLMDAGEVTGIVGTLDDVTDRKAADEALRRSDEFRARVMESATEGIFAMDMERRFVLLNRRACEISGYTRDELLGQTPALFYSPETDARAVAQFLQVVESGQPVPGYEVDIIRKGGAPGTVRVGLTPLMDDGTVAGVVGVVEDVTERRRLEEQVLQSQKMESIGRLAGGLAHDFNNLMTAVIGYADLSLLALDPADPVAADVKGIRATADRAANLAHQLLAFSRRQVIEPRIVDINDLIIGAHSMLRQLTGENIQLVMQMAPDAHPVKVDPTQFTQVVVNLVVNARDAMPAGGTLTLATASVETDGRGTAELPGEAGTYVRLTVTDTGAGMPEEVLQHVFEPFFTTKETGKGTGLGLATCYGIVKQAGGNIVGCSEPGAGSTFAVYLPAVAGPLTAAAADAPGLPRGHETILLAEDEIPLQKLASRVLGWLGYIVLPAADGSEALRIAKQHSGPIDLLISDVVMPGMNGRELAEQLTRQRPSVRVLLTSGYAGDEVVGGDGGARAASFLPKPYSPQSLARRVRELLDAER